MAAPDMLLVEDDAALAELLIWHFEREGYHVRHTPDGEEAMILASERVPDVVLLDWMIDNIAGIEVCRRLRRADETANVPIIMLTARGEEEDRIRGLTTGADDYVSKPFSLRELMVRVEAVLRRSGKPVGGEKIALSGILFDGRNLQAVCGDAVREITRREMDIMVYLFRNRERIVSKKELLTEVWHYADAGIETRTVDIHIQKLRKKILELTPECGLIQTVRGEGYRLESRP